MEAIELGPLADPDLAEHALRDLDLDFQLLHRGNPEERRADRSQFTGLDHAPRAEAGYRRDDLRVGELDQGQQEPCLGTVHAGLHLIVTLAGGAALGEQLLRALEVLAGEVDIRLHDGEVGLRLPAVEEDEHLPLRDAVAQLGRDAIIALPR